MMPQRNTVETAPVLETRRNGTTRRDIEVLLEAKDETITELKEQVAFLRGELERKDAILSRIAEGIGERLPARASKSADGLRVVAPGGLRDSDRTMDAREEPERMPDGYRVVAVASDAWVLVSPRGLRVTGYRGELDLGKAALDAREHLGHQR